MTKGVLWTAIGNWGNQITALLVFTALTRLLNPESFGLIAMASVFTSFVNVFAEQGFGQAIVQRNNIEPEHLDTAFWTNIIIGTGLTLIGILSSKIVANIYDEPKLQSVIILLSITFLLTSLSSTQQALLERELNFRALSIRQLVAATIGGIVGIGSALGGAGVYALVANTLITNFVGTIILWRVNDWRPGLRFSPTHFRELASFGASIVGVKITNVLRTRLDDFLIGYFLGAEALGYYVVAYRLGRLTLSMFTSVMSRVAVTIFARLQSNSEHLRMALYKFTSMTGLITFPIFTGLIILAPDLIVALSGEKWLPSAPVMRILSIGGFSLSLQYFLAYLIISMGKPKYLFIINAISTIVTAIAFIIGAQYSITIVAIAYVIVNISFFNVYLAVANRLLSLDMKKYLVSGCAFLIPSLVMGISLLIINSYIEFGLDLYPRLLFLILLGSLIYIVTVYVFQREMCLELRELAISFIPITKTATH